MTAIESGKDIWYLFYLLDRAGGVEGAIRLQKLIFICKIGAGVPFAYEFTEYYYGPYSPELTRDLERFRQLGLLSIERRPSKRLTAVGERPEIAIYRLTDQGKASLNAHRSEVEEENATKIEEVLRDCLNLPLEELIDLSLKIAGVEEVPPDAISYFARKPLRICEGISSAELVHRLLAKKKVE